MTGGQAITSQSSPITYFSSRFLYGDRRANEGDRLGADQERRSNKRTTVYVAAVIGRIGGFGRRNSYRGRGLDTPLERPSKVSDSSPTSSNDALEPP
jgi:hypothetical protein